MWTMSLYPIPCPHMQPRLALDSSEILTDCNKQDSSDKKIAQFDSRYGEGAAQANPPTCISASACAVPLRYTYPEHRFVTPSTNSEHVATRRPSVRRQNTAKRCSYLSRHSSCRIVPIFSQLALPLPNAGRVSAQAETWAPVLNLNRTEAELILGEGAYRCSRCMDEC